MNKLNVKGIYCLNYANHWWNTKRKSFGTGNNNEETPLSSSTMTFCFFFALILLPV